MARNRLANQGSRADLLAGRCLVSRGLAGPDDEAYDHLAVAEVAHVSRDAAGRRTTYPRSPRRRGVADRRRVGRRGLPDGAERVEVGVDGDQFVVVVLVGVLVGARVVGVVHAGAEVRVGEVLVLVVQPEGVPDLLADDQLPPGGGVVLGGVEVGVVELDGALGDVHAAGHRDRRHAQPAGVAVGRVADLHAAGGRLAGTGVAGPTGGDRRVEYGGLAPVAGGGGP